MDPIIWAAIGGIIVAAAAVTVRSIRSARRARRREQKFKEMLDLATEALKADLARLSPRIQAVEVDPQSPLGQQIAKMLGLDKPCQCPNCEEERRIAHAEQQKRDGQ